MSVAAGLDWTEDDLVPVCPHALVRDPRRPRCLLWLEHEGPHVGVALWPRDAPYYIPGPVFVRWYRDDALAAERVYSFEEPPR